MHHKTFIFKNSIGGEVVVFGSLNPTQAAFHGNEEALQIRNHPPLIKRFIEQFEKLKSRSYCYQVKKINELSNRPTRTKKIKKQLRKEMRKSGASLPRFPLSRDQIYDIFFKNAT